MRKLLALLMLFVSIGFVAATPTVVNGHVYQQGTHTGVPNVEVTVTCDTASGSDMTDNLGFYVVELDDGCDVGDNLSVCAGQGNCDDGIVRAIPRIEKNISYVNLEIPEFGAVAASVALAGAVAGFVLLRKKK